MGQVRVQRIHRIRRGMEPLAVVDHGDRDGRNVRHDKSLLCAGRARRVDAKQPVVRLAYQLRSGGWPRMDRCSRIIVRQMASQHRWIRHASGLPFVMLARGDLSAYRPLQIAGPTMSIFYCFNIFTKLAVGALSGFEYVGILAGETRAPARNIGRSVIIAAPIIALIFIFGTSSVLAFIGNNQIDLIGPVPQTLRLGLHSFRIAGVIASVAIVLMTVRSISSISIHFTGSSRLPMVAGWDHLLPAWFSRLHVRYKTPINSIMFVGAITLVIAISSQIGAGMQEAFQLVDNAANVFYGIVYAVMFAIPIVGALAIRAGARTWLRLAAACGFAVCLLAIFFTIYPIIDVPSPLTFAAKIITVTVIANAIGAAIFSLGQRRRAAQENSTA